jgi:hypothetical protein
MEIHKKKMASFKHELTKIIFGYYSVSDGHLFVCYVDDFTAVMDLWNEKTDGIKGYMRRQNIIDEDITKLFKKCPFFSNHRNYDENDLKQIRKYCKRYLSYFYKIHVVDGEKELN